MASSSAPNEASSLAAAPRTVGQVAEVQPSQRPEPGIARGRWEAPAWIFWTVALVTSVAALAWAVVALREALFRPGNRPGRRRR